MKSASLTIIFLLWFLAMLCPPASGASEPEVRRLGSVRIVRRAHVLHFDSDPSERFNAAKASLLSKKRQSLISSLRRMLHEVRNNARRYELSLRLGRLYLEDYYASLQAAQTSGPLKTLDAAITLYLELKRKTFTQPRTDEVLYFLSLAEQDRGGARAAAENLQLLVTRFPNSRFTPDALIELGDYHFLVNEMKTATAYYDEVIRRADPKLVAYASYKRAWCEYNLGNAGKSVQSFKFAIQAEEKSEGATIRIRKEALHDLALPLVELKQVKEAIDLFAVYGEPYLHEGLELMAKLYVERTQRDKAIALWTYLLQAEPMNAKAPGYDLEIANAHDLSGDRAGALDHLGEILPKYLAGSSWAEVNAAQRGVVEDAARKLEETARNYALNYHAFAQRTNSAPFYSLATRAYTKYLEVFPRNPHTAELRCRLAEILERNGDHARAADQAYQAFRESSDPGMQEKALRFSLSALDNLLNAERARTGQAAVNAKSSAKLREAEDAAITVTAYTSVEQTLLQRVGEYLKRFPRAADAPDAVYEAAYLRYLHHDFQSARSAFQWLVESVPSHPTANSAAHLLLDILNRTKDYAALVTTCQKFLQISQFNQLAFRNELYDIIRHAALKRVQAMEGTGEFKRAADAYVEYTMIYGVQDEALYEKALYNAAINYTKAGATGKGLETTEKFLRRFPRSPLTENMLLQLGKTYERMAKLELAAQAFQRFAQGYPANPQSKSALRMAGLYYWGAGENEKALSAMNAYLHSYPAEASLVEKDMLAVYESRHDLNGALALHERALARRGLSVQEQLAHRVAMVELTAQREGILSSRLVRPASELVAAHSGRLARTPEGAALESKVLFWEVQSKEDRFRAVRLELPQARLESNLRLKLSLLQGLERDYARIASLGDPEIGLGAMYRTASAYRQLRLDIQQAPVPTSLSAKELDDYHSEIARTFLKPFDQKALSLAERCVDKAQDLKVFSAWTAKCQGLAAELNPDRHVNPRTLYLPSLQVARGPSPVPEKKHSSPLLASLAYLGASVLGRPVVSAGDSSTAVVNGQGSAESRESQKVSPEKQQRLLEMALETKPDDFSLHNLLALAQLDRGNVAGAKVLWLSLLSQGTKQAAVWNNLGVVATLEGKDEEARQDFEKAAALEPSKEALTNLAFLALKYQSGFQARKYFERALAMGAEENTEIGLAEAMVQERNLDGAREHLSQAQKRYRNNPYGALAQAYFLVEVDHQHDTARQFLSDFIEEHSLQNDSRFQLALREANHVMKNGEQLPSIEP